ncbi:hypothetical protein G7046_g3022 [Stylonectria norvegica]|nr:hypothetical protein G7046_g3022 [Stylonectria norvegica]
MTPTLVNKASYQFLHAFSGDSLDTVEATSPPCSADQDSPGDQSHVLKLRRGSSKVWSDIRGAIKAIGRSSRGGSQGSTVLEWSPNGSSSQLFKGKFVTMKKDGGSAASSPKGKPIILRDRDEGSTSSSRKGKGRGLVPKDLIKKLGLSHLGLASNTTLVHRDTSLRPGSSLQGLGGTQSAPASDPDSSENSAVSSRLSTAADDSTRKTSVDSRFSILTKDTTKRRHSRRTPWTRSSPEGGALGTIVESGVDQAQPTIQTVERVAAAKIYLETHFNELWNKPEMRSVRRQYLESQLYYSPHLTPEQKQAIRCSFYNQETWHLRETRVMKRQTLLSYRGIQGGPYLENYEPLSVLGKGSFGVVYAMKVIRKSDMLRSSQEGHLRAERDFLIASEGSTWIVPLVASFQDADNLYLVMDYMPGGDFLGLLIRENILHEAVARFYIAEMIVAVEEAHRLKFIHRDIKPDNFLVSASGHLKISDFGLAFDGHWSHDASYYNCHRYSLVKKLGINVDGDETDQKDNRQIGTQLKWYQTLMSGLERHEKKAASKNEDLEDLLGWRNRCGNRSAANSVVGTSQYMAPEVVQGHTYDGRSEEGRQRTKQNILHKEHKSRFYFPQRPTASDKCKDLIYRLIQEKESRLCSRRYLMKDRGQLDGGRSADYYGRYVFPDDAEDIKAHRWFRNIPWDRLQTLTPPFIPHINGAEDTHYFDESEPIEDWSESYPSGAAMSPEDVKEVLGDFRESVQDVAMQLVAVPYDSARLRKIDQQVEGTSMLAVEEKEVLKHFVRLYGRKERKRARDRLLRDKDIKEEVMDIRKKTAFMGCASRSDGCGAEEDVVLLVGLLGARYAPDCSAVSAVSDRAGDGEEMRCWVSVARTAKWSDSETPRCGCRSVKVTVALVTTHPGLPAGASTSRPVDAKM